MYLPFWSRLRGGPNEARLWERRPPWTRQFKGNISTMITFCKSFYERDSLFPAFSWKIDYPLKWAHATEAAWDLRCSVEIRGTRTRWNRPEFLSICLRWHHVCSGRSPDGALDGSAEEKAVTRVFWGWFFSLGLVSYYLCFKMFFDSTKSSQISEGIRQPLLLHKSKMKDFSYRFIKCCTLMLWKGTTPFPYGKLAIKKKAGSGLKIQYRLYYWLMSAPKAKIKKAAWPFVISDFQH